jgi:hypothetical protein
MANGSNPFRQYSIMSCSIVFFLLVVVSSEASDFNSFYSPQKDASFEEYDYSILDPTTAFGSPLGGYSRATRSRLAALPLYLFDVVEAPASDQEHEPLYMEVSDTEGQNYACRVYHQDELEPDSLNESMFEPPKLRPRKTELSREAKEEAEQADKVETELTEEEKKLLPPPPPQTMNSEVEKILQVHIRLSALEGICGQLHRGWWSYEWCYEGSVSQFHVQVDKRGAQVRVEAVSTLGSYKTRTVITQLIDQPPNLLAAGRKHEYARVVDTYDNGELCEGQPRKTFVHMVCCSATIMEKFKGLLHRDGERIVSNAASVASLAEQPTCVYNITVCTPFLCNDEVREDDDEEEVAKAFAKLVTPTRELARRSTKVPGSVRDILEQSLGTPDCIVSDTGGWWMYEYCHGGAIRQYHQTVGTRKTTSGAVIM